MPTETYERLAERLNSPDAEPTEEAPRRASQDADDSATVVVQMGEDPGDLSQPQSTADRPD
jgi:hypothetical protein